VNPSSDPDSPTTSLVRPPADKNFWLSHGWGPLLIFLLVFGAWYVLALDRLFADAWFFDRPSHHWLGTGSGDWWAHRLIHTGGGWFVRGIAAVTLVVWLLSFATPRLRASRRTALFIVIAMFLATGVVGLLKSVTNVDCPWDLAGYGGGNPYVALFADRPDALARAKCFPGAHASSGFALLCFYFVLRDRSRRLALWALAGALAVGLLFSIGQEARGAHFLSHDLTSAVIVWFVQLGLYAWMLKPTTPRRRAPPSSG
jgi:membrane-associated PAP2 superfamily phosphatase